MLSLTALNVIVTDGDDNSNNNNKLRIKVPCLVPGI